VYLLVKFTRTEVESRTFGSTLPLNSVASLGAGPTLSDVSLGRQHHLCFLGRGVG